MTKTTKRVEKTPITEAEKRKQISKNLESVVENLIERSEKEPDLKKKINVLYPIIIYDPKAEHIETIESLTLKLPEEEQEAVRRETKGAIKNAFTAALTRLKDDKNLEFLKRAKEILNYINDFEIEGKLAMVKVCLEVNFLAQAQEILLTFATLEKANFNLWHDLFYKLNTKEQKIETLKIMRDKHDMKTQDEFSAHSF